MPDPERIGKYHVRRLIKRGGMGVLYLCFDPDVRRHVAIKVLRTDLDTPELRERFEREVTAVGGLHHPNVVTTFGTERHDGELCLVMEYLAGETLADLIRRRPALSVRRKLQILHDICSGLGHAHRAGIIHRDIKPANVMLDAHGTVKVLDFGIARTSDSDLTLHGSLMGTLNYMAPEQVTGGTIDARTDVFAVGAVGYELFAFRAAFGGTMAKGLIPKLLDSAPPPLWDICPDLPPEIPPIFSKAMHKDPAQRYSDVRLLGAALASAARWLPPDPADDDPLAAASSEPTLLIPGRGAAGGPASSSGTASAPAALAVDSPARASEAMTTGEFGRAAATTQPELPAPTAPARRRRLYGTAAGVAVAASVWLLWQAGGAAPTAPTHQEQSGATAATSPAAPPPPAAEPTPLPSSMGNAPAETASRATVPSTTSPTSRSPELPPLPQRETGDVPPVQDTDRPAVVQNATRPPVVQDATPSVVEAVPPAPPAAPIPRAQPADVTPEPPAAAASPAPEPSIAPPAPRPPTDRESIVAAVNRYAAAMTAMNVSEIAAIFPMPPAALGNLERQFAELISEEVTPMNVRVQIEGGMAATVNCELKYDVRFRDRRGRQVNEFGVTLRLRKQEDGRWLIVSRSGR